jgi:hypothetical protein
VEVKNVRVPASDRRPILPLSLSSIALVLQVNMRVYVKGSGGSLEGLFVLFLRIKTSIGNLLDRR